MPGVLRPDLFRAGDGEPLVLIHGFTNNWRVWTPVLHLLVPHFEVIAPTLAGHSGGREMPARETPHNVPETTDLFERHLDELGLGTVHVVGSSLGGGIALELAKRGRARSVVGLAPAGGMTVGDRREALRLIRLFQWIRISTRSNVARLPWVMRSPSRRRVVFRDAMVRGDQVPHHDAVEMARATLDCTVLGDVFAVLRHGEPWVTDLDRVRCPTMIAWGSRDRILPLERHGLRLRDEIPGVDFRVLPGLGHLPMWDDAHQIADLILEHVGATTGAGEEGDRAAGAAAG